MPNFLRLDFTMSMPLFALAVTLISLHAFVRNARLRLNSNILSRNISFSLDGEFVLAQLKGRARRVMTDGGHKMCVLPVEVNS